VAIYDIGREGDLNYIAMDYLPGGSVHDKMITGLTGDEALKVTREIANALDHAHERGYIHRDIKPENILFRTDNSAVLSDFGVAKGIVGASRMTHVGTVVGTPHYMSPEQTRGQTVDARSDLYSLGVVFYEMLTGTLPYQGEDTVTIALKHISAPIPKLPLQYQPYQKILEKFLAKDPAQRFQTGREVTEAIEQLQASARTPYITNSAPEDLSVTALVRALIAASAHAVQWRWQKLMNLRWSKEQGFHQKTKRQDSVFGDEIAPTLFATRIQQQTHINRQLLAQHKALGKKIAAGLALIVGWCFFSLLAQGHTNNWPGALKTATRATASLFGYSADNPVAQHNARAQVASSTESVSSSTASAMATAELPTGTTSTSESSSSAAPRFPLAIKTIPAGAQVRLLNIPDKYKEGILLPAGRYKIELTKAGYKTKTEWAEIKTEALNLQYTLEEAPPEIEAKPGTPVAVNGGKNAPELVRIPAGQFIMGDDSNIHTAPAHKVIISRAFAMSKYEITFAEYDQFAQATNRALPGDNGWGRETRPVIHVSWDDAQAYVQWLSKTTGKKYRLPTEAEWEYASRAGSSERFWWGDNEQDARGKANCRRGCYSSYSGLFGSKSAPVGSYTPNAFGLYDTAGNVSEWVQDCYEDNFANASSQGQVARDSKNCASRVVRGGSTRDNVQRLISSARDNIPSGYLNDVLGFRVVMELN
jgi:serine/threonine-protein kinase PpkA